MRALHRNQLVWLTPAGWQRMLASPWDPQAQEILRYWQAAQLPLVVCTQRVPSGLASISLGLPAPAVWDRRKLALEVFPREVECSGAFPTLGKMLARAERPGAMPALRSTLEQLQSLHPQPQIYGSFGWQHLTGLDYARAESDIDLRIEVSDHTAAAETVRALSRLATPLRLDGELAFPDGSAIAWREYLQWMEGKATQVLVKSRLEVRLVDGLDLTTVADRMGV